MAKYSPIELKIGAVPWGRPTVPVRIDKMLEAMAGELERKIMGTPPKEIDSSSTDSTPEIGTGLPLAPGALPPSLFSRGAVVYHADGTVSPVSPAINYTDEDKVSEDKVSEDTVGEDKVSESTTTLPLGYAIPAPVFWEIKEGIYPVTDKPRLDRAEKYAGKIKLTFVEGAPVPIQRVLVYKGTGNAPDADKYLGFFESNGFWTIWVLPDLVEDL